MEQILLAAIMILYKNTEVKVCSRDVDTYYFDFVAGVLQGNKLAPYRTSIDLMKENGFTLAKERSKRYSTQTITDADYLDDIAPLANTPSQLLSLERAAGDIGLHMSADKTEYMRFNQRGDISTRNGDSLKLVDNFTYIRSSV